MQPAPLIDLETLADRFRTKTETRQIVAIAGPPGSGKSTLAEMLVERLDRQRPGSAALLPMDGFHFDNAVLTDMGRLPFKGAPDTFDVGGLDHMLRRLGNRDEDAVAVPVFDRSIEIARAGGRLIDKSVDIIVAEGNYLLLGETPWSRLRAHFDLTVLVDVPEDILRQRLTRRWEGFGLSDDAIRAKVEANDLPNGYRVMRDSIRPDFRFKAPAAV